MGGFLTVGGGFFKKKNGGWVSDSGKLPLPPGGRSSPQFQCRSCGEVYVQVMPPNLCTTLVFN